MPIKTINNLELHKSYSLSWEALLRNAIEVKIKNSLKRNAGILIRTFDIVNVYLDFS